MNIRVDLNTAIYDGTEVVFRSPVDCSQITGLIVYYKNKGSTAFQEFALADAHGNNVGDIDHLFAENVVVKVILDVTTGMAFVQNADTNAYLESRFDELNARIDGAYVLVKGDDDALSLEGVTCTELLEKFKASEELVLYRYKKDNSGNTIAIRYYYCMGIETRDGKETLVFQYSLGAENEYITLYVKGTPTGAVDVITITTDYKRLDVTIDDATMKASHTAYEIMDLWRKGWTVYCNGDMLYEAYGHSGSEASEIGVVFKGGFYAGADGYAYLKGETTINGNGDVSYKTYNLPILDDAQAGEYNTWSAKKIAGELAKGGGGAGVLNVTVDENMKASHTAKEIYDHVQKGGTANINGLPLMGATERFAQFGLVSDGESNGSSAELIGMFLLVDANGNATMKECYVPGIDDENTGPKSTWSSEKIASEIGSIETALDAIIEIQNSLIGGGSV